MKGINISCNSLDSTTIISSTEEIIIQSTVSPPTVSACSSSSSTIGGRAIDRHNPIITDEKRRGPISRSAPTTPCVTNHYIKTPASPLMMHARKKKSKKATQKLYTNTSGLNFGDDDHHHGEVRRKSDCKPSDVMMKGGCTIGRKGVDYVSPPESSRYLLDDTSFLNVLSDFDPLLKLVPVESNKNEGQSVLLEDNIEVIAKPSKPPSSSSSTSGSSDQVVVLRVSLHCRGCERKLKKHLSRMPGVRSFNIDFTAKKVTVVGDVTPLGVLSNISKVKNAQLWTPTLSSSFPTK